VNPPPDKRMTLNEAAAVFAALPDAIRIPIRDQEWRTPGTVSTHEDNERFVQEMARVKANVTAGRPPYPVGINGR
jgi:uncharacterized protein (DUF2267 family)